LRFAYLFPLWFLLFVICLLQILPPQKLSHMRFPMSQCLVLTTCVFLSIVVIDSEWVLAQVKPAASNAALAETFNSKLKPLLTQYCGDCHGGDEREGGVSFNSVLGDATDKLEVELWQQVLEQVEIGLMPPEKSDSPTAWQREHIVAWIKDVLVAGGKGHAIRARLLLPEYGNRVSHELLFSGEIKTPAYTPARLWRMSPEIFRGKRYQGHAPGGLQAKPLTFASKSSGIRDYASQEVLGESGFLSLQMAFDDIISNQMHDRTLAAVNYGANAGKPTVIAGTDSFKAIAESKGAPDLESMQRVIREEFYRATGRRITAEEEQRFLDFMKTSIEEAGNESGLKISVMAIYLSTESVYRLELGRPLPDEHGRRMLSPQEIAIALAFALGDVPPAGIPILQEAMQEKKLSTKSDIEVVVRKLIAAGAPPLRKELPAAPYPRLIQEGEHGFGWYPRIVRFFEEFFQYAKAAGTFKDSPGEGVGSRALVGWPQGHIAAIVNEDQNVFEELLTSPRFNNNKAVLIAYMKAKYAQRLSSSPASGHPKIQRWHDDMLNKAKPLKSETFRAGLLTDNSWLIAHSTNNENHPVHRGIWIRQRLLAGSLPALPINVDAQIPEGNDKTLRERHAVTRQAECWKCHKLFDPLGMPFESFDDRGWIRAARYFDKAKNEYLPQPQISEEELKKMTKKSAIDVRPVDATGAITGTGEDGIDGPVKDASELVNRLARSTRVRRSFIRHTFRYWMGRNEMLSDASTLLAADRAYVESGGKFSEVLVSLLTSDSFLYRK
jgi:hypothetical protein